MMSIILEVGRFHRFILVTAAGWGKPGIWNARECRGV